MPTADGTNGQQLTTNGSGGLSWANAGSGGGGGGASALNDLSDVSYSSGDLTITSLDTIKTSDSAHNSGGTSMTISAGSTTAGGGTSDMTGGSLVLQTGKGKGSGNGGNIEFKVSSISTSGDSLNSYDTAMILYSNNSSKPTGLDNCAAFKLRRGNILGDIITTIKIDIAGLKGPPESLGTEGGVVADANVGTGVDTFIVKIDKPTQGLIYKIEMICLELPTDGGNPPGVFDIGLSWNASKLAQGSDINDNNALIMPKSWSINDIDVVDTSSFRASGSYILNDKYIYISSTADQTSLLDTGQYLIKIYGVEPF